MEYIYIVIEISQNVKLYMLLSLPNVLPIYRGGIIALGGLPQYVYQKGKRRNAFDSLTLHFYCGRPYRRGEYKLSAVVRVVLIFIGAWTPLTQTSMTFF